MRVAFFSRGRGHGHAIPDMAIATELARVAPEIDIRFISYATGAATFRSAGIDVIDLGLPESNGFVETILRASQVIAGLQPEVVVAHEEFPALVAAAAHGIPSIFISAWLPQATNAATEALACASSIIVLSEPGIFTIPRGLKVKPAFVGSIHRKMAHTVADRTVIRREMDIAPDARVITVIPGGSATESKSPIADSVLGAFSLLKAPNKHLFWISRNDCAAMRERTRTIEHVTVLPFVSPIERVIAASDIVITKATRGATLDAEAVGVPSISLSPGTNPIDDLLVPRIANNIALNANAIDADVLLHYMDVALQRRASPAPRHGLRLAATRLHADLVQLRRPEARASLQSLEIA